MKSHRKLSKYCSIHGKNREIFGPYNIWTLVKNNIPDIWNWTCWTLFGSEIEVGGQGGHGKTKQSKWGWPEFLGGSKIEEWVRTSKKISITNQFLQNFFIINNIKIWPFLQSNILEKVFLFFSQAFHFV